MTKKKLSKDERREILNIISVAADMLQNDETNKIGFAVRPINVAHALRNIIARLKEI